MHFSNSVWALATVLSLSLLGCDTGAEAGSNGVATAESAIRGGEILREGHPGVVKFYVDDDSRCTGSMINERVIVTAGHCLSDFENGSTHTVLSYGWDQNFRGSGRYRAYHLSGDVGGTDIGVLVAESPWTKFRTGDGVRIVYRTPEPTETYQEQLRIYGSGYIGENTDSGYLRTAQFTWFRNLFMGGELFSSASSSQSICKGDSGGPTMFKPDWSSPADLLVAVISGMSYMPWDTHTVCANPDATQKAAMLDSNMDWLLSTTGMKCHAFNYRGYGYLRCFDMPMISDAPPPEQMYGTKGKAVAVAMTTLS